MKTSAQLRRAQQQRKANVRAKAAGAPLPHPNPWDSLMKKLPEGASREERLQWYGELAERCMPKDG